MVFNKSCHDVIVKKEILYKNGKHNCLEKIVKPFQSEIPRCFIYDVKHVESWIIVLTEICNGEPRFEGVFEQKLKRKTKLTENLSFIIPEV
jgi:hypothetical protein